MKSSHVTLHTNLQFNVYLRIKYRTLRQRQCHPSKGSRTWKVAAAYLKIFVTAVPIQHLLIGSYGSDKKKNHGPDSHFSSLTLNSNVSCLVYQSRQRGD